MAACQIRGRRDTPWDVEHMAGQSDAKTHTKNTTAPPPAAPQGPPAPEVVVVAVFSPRFGRPRARNPTA
eukprot:11718062-Heterocapsa_arctica.AAC.1